MLAFICTHKPLSVNARRRAAYDDNLRTAYRAAHADETLPDGPLYGKVYYFHMEPTGLDADNLSKPVWDALKGLPYSDDKSIRLREAGLIDLRNTPVETFDLTTLPGPVAQRLIEVLGSAPHVVYVEIGKVEPEMYEFGRSLKRLLP